MQLSACTSLQNKHSFNGAITFFAQLTRTICAIFLMITEDSVLMALLFYNKDMLEKVTMQRTKQFSAFSLLPKEPG